MRAVVFGVERHGGLPGRPDKLTADPVCVAPRLSTKILQARDAHHARRDPCPRMVADLIRDVFVEIEMRESEKSMEAVWAVKDELTLPCTGA